MLSYKKREDVLKVCTISGTNEIGRNCSFVQYGKDILVVDAGFSFPGEEMYGIDYLIPNTKYLRENRQKIRGILITHGHLDHIGALPYILRDLDFPTIYAGDFAAALIKEKLKEFNLDNRVKIVTVRKGEQIHLGVFDITFIGVTHSVPDSNSIFIESPRGNIFFSGDYKIDDTPTNEPMIDRDKYRSLRGKIDLALLESTNAYKPGKAQSETEIAKTLERIIIEHNGRVIIAAFASLVTRIHSVMQIAKKHGKKVVIAGRSLETNLRIAREQRYIDIPDDTIVSERDMRKYPDNKLIIMSTGGQAERYAALNRIALGQHRTIQAKKGDLVIMSSSEIPENIAKIERMTDRLIRLGVELIKNSEEEVHASGHGLQEDMQMFYELIEPKFIMPVHGSLTFRYQNKKNYVSWGHNPDKVLLTDDGQVWEFDGATWNRSVNIESKPILIDGLGVRDVGDIVLRDRKQLAEYGMFVIILNLSKNTKQLIANPRFVSRGFIYMKNSQELLKEIENMVRDTHREWMHMRDKRIDELIDAIEKKVGKYVFKKTEREPIIIPVVV
ncbi:ribonuclease J [bacterium]|nr:ribonuclease J [bacterium]